jgi:hypothetical protein
LINVYKNKVFIILQVCIILSIKYVYSQTNYEKYIKNNLLLFDTIHNQYIDSLLGNKVFYVAGEWHNFEKENRNVELTLFKYLYYYKNVRVFIMEYALSCEYFINKYLETGDENILIRLGNNCPKNVLDISKELYKFYKTLNKYDKFKVKTIDEDISDLTIILFKELFPKEEPPIEIRKSIEKIKNSMNLNNDEFIAFIKTIQNDIKIHEDSYKKYLKNDFDFFIRNVEGAYLGCYLNKTKLKDSTVLKERELFMYKNMLSIIKEYPNCSFFGQFGGDHTTNTIQKDFAEFKYWNSLISMLNTNTDFPLKDKVLSMRITYYPFKLKRNDTVLEDNICIALSEYVKKSKIKLSDNILLFNVRGKDSPFMEYQKVHDFILVVK